MSKFISTHIRTIKSKLILSIALVHALLMTLFIFDLTERQKSFLLQESTESTEAIADTLAINATPWMLSNDVSGLDEIVKSHSNQPNLVFAILMNKEGKVLAYYHRNNTSRLNESNSVAKSPTFKLGSYLKVQNNTPFQSQYSRQTYYNNQDVIDVASPIIVNQNLIGWARVQQSRKNISNNIEILTTEGAVYTLVAILLGSLFAWFMASSLTKRIQKLIKITHAVRLGERNIDIQISGKDELNLMADNFAAMLKNLEHIESALAQSRDEAEITLQSIGDAVIVVKTDATINYMNPVAEVLTGWHHNRALGKHIDDVMHIIDDNSQDPIVNPIFRALQEQEKSLLENNAMLVNRHGETIALEESATPIIDRDGMVIGAVIVFHDASIQRKLQKQLQWQAHHDSLTGLHNRQAFELELEHLLDETRKNPHKLSSLIYIDLDQFKLVNDTVGHTAGDVLLKQISKAIQSQLSEQMFFARIGGDEFAILLEDHSLENAENIADTVLKTIGKQHFFWEKRSFEIGASIGIAFLHPEHSKTTILSHADMACYLAKDSGRNQIKVYLNNDDEQQRFLLDWVSEINLAISEKRFLLFAQRLHPLQTSDGIHLEVLVRLQNPDGSLVMPGSFLPAAERFELMSKLDNYIIQETFSWLKRHPKMVSLVNINISGQSLADKRFNDQLIEQLKNNISLNSKVCFEITETVAITHMQETIDFLNRIKTFGCSLALDDFGSGFSSFTWLKQLPVDYVKIDGSFVKEVVEDPVNAAMVRAMVEVSSEMGIETVAEYVENQAILEWLAKNGIHYAQGFHIHKPEPLTQIQANRLHSD